MLLCAQSSHGGTEETPEETLTGLGALLLFQPCHLVCQRATAGAKKGKGFNSQRIILSVSDDLYSFTWYTL
jgi:hypothetical protein